MRVLFFGYSQIGASALELLLARGDQVLAIVTHRDDARENRWYRTPADVAARCGLPVVCWDDLGPAADRVDGVVRLATQQVPDLVLSVFFREILPAAVLALPRIAAVNLHPSYLPAYRGRAPINWVLVNGESSTGVTLHHMVQRADAGDIVAQRQIAVRPRETALTLYHEIERAAIELLADTLPLFEDGRAPRFPQDEALATYVRRRSPADGRLDWSWPASRIDCLVRAVAPPWPGAFFDLEGKRVMIAAGEPADPISPERSVAPATIRREPERLLIAASDRWFRIDAAEGLDVPRPRHTRS